MTAFELMARAGALGIRLWVDGDQLRYEAPSQDVLSPTLLDGLRSNRREIIRFLHSARSAQDRSPVAPVPPDTLCPLSSAQQRFLFLDKLEGPSSSYNLSSAFILEGALDIEALSASVREIVRRHAILRTRFVASETGFTQITTDWVPELRFIDLSDLPGEERERAFDELVKRESSRPFNVPDGPHVRAALVRLAPGIHAFLVDMHHIVSDGGSIAPFVRDLHACYDAYRQGRPAPLAPLRIQYRDFAHWQRSNAGLMASQLEYWVDRLAGAPAFVQLPLDHPRPAEQTFCGDSIRVLIPADFEAKIQGLRERFGFTPFHTLLAALVLLLHKYSRQDDIVIGTPVSSRTHEDIEALIGPFLNMVAVRTELTGDLSLRQVVEQIRRAMVEGIDHADVPFEDVVAAVQPGRSPAYSPLFNVMFVLEDTPVGILNLPGLKTRTLSVNAPSAKYDLTLVVQRDPRGLNCWFKYNSDLFDCGTVERLAGHYLNLLAVMAENIEETVQSVSPLSRAEREQQLFGWNDTAKDYPSDRCTYRFFEEQARATPDAIAIDFEDRSLTYAQTNRQANQLAHFLIAEGVGQESIVAIRAERSLEMVIAVLGTLKAGASYAPIDPEYPVARQEFMTADARAPVLLTQRKFAASPFHGHSRVVVIEEVLDRSGSLPQHDPPLRASPDNPAYVIYTSGSTGTPKGVVTEHRAIANNLLWMQDQWPIGPRDVFLLKAAFSFDVSFKEILWPLMFGARLVIATPGGHQDPAYLHSVISKKKVTVIHLVPTMLDYFLSDRRASAAESLRIVMCGGEALSLDLKNRFCRRFDAGLLHLYGPTEAAIAVTGVLFKRDDGLKAILLGKPMANCQIYLLDETLELVPVGAPGELFIGGVPLARGYHRRPELTSERFIANPFNSAPGSRLYRSGDLARFLPDGNIQFLGRIDHQIKMRGLRLELGEVEASLRQHPVVGDCLVTVYADAAGVKKLVAYVVFAPSATASGHELAAFLRQRLPAYMVPAAYTPLQAIPTSPNGKADRSALPPPSFAGIESPVPAAPSTSAEQVLIELWKDVLGVKQLGVHDHFFEAGGHSIALLRLQNKIEEAFHRRVRITELFQHPTIAEMARLLSGEKETVVEHPARRQPARRPTSEDAVAIVGMAGRFPGAQDLEQFWEAIANGRESIRFFSEEELIAEGFDRDLLKRPNFIRARGYVEGLDRFDADFFHYTPAEATILDPQFRLLLECTQHVFDDAGYDPSQFTTHGASVGVYVSASRSGYYLNHIQPRRDLLETLGATQLAIATDKSFAATHLAYRFDFKGPAVTVDTACSSSLVAVHHACASLLRGECSLAIAGGASVDAPLKGGYPFVEGGIGSPDGRCRPFDSQARGTVKGMGGGLVLLKRLSEAVADGDHIYAVIGGTAVNNDGAAKVGFTAPSGEGQAQAVAVALAAAGVEPDQIGFIEAHGTGTALGDPIEFAALTEVFPRGRVALGAVKANIGHLDAAAGIAGLIKTALALDRRMIPPMAAFHLPNPEVPLDGSAFYIPSLIEEWAVPSGELRRAGVSSFGIGGTNAHAVLEEAPERAPVIAGESAEVICLSARSPESMERYAKALAQYLVRHPGITLREVAFTLRRRRQFDYRSSVVVGGVEELIAGIESGAFRNGTVNGHWQEASAVDSLQAGYRRVPLPGYAFERRRFWIDPLPMTTSVAPVPDKPWFVTHSWIRAQLSAGSPARGGRWLILDDGSSMASKVAAFLDKSGYSVVRVSEIQFNGQLAEHEFVLDFRGVQFLETAAWRGRLGIVTYEAYTVTGSEQNSAMRSAPMRDTGIEATILDLDTAAIANGVDARIVREMSAATLSPIVAFRGPYRWLPTLRDVSLDHLPPAGSIPPGKAHVIVNGLTPFGLQLAEHLAAGGIDRLALLYDAEPALDAAQSRLDSMIEGGVHLRLLRRHEGQDLVELLRNGFGSVNAIYYNLVELDDRSALTQISQLMQLPGLDFGVVLCASKEPANEPPLITAIREVVTRSAAWMLVSSDAWFEAGVLTAAFDVMANVAVNDRVPDIHLPGDSLRMIAASRSEDIGEGLNPTERKIERVWKQLIGVPRVALDDDFFTIGGDSLTATQAAARCTSLFGVTVSPTLLYDEPTIRGLAKLIDGIAGVKARAAAANTSEEREELQV